MTDWQILVKKVVHKNPWFYIEKILMKRPDGSQGPYFVFRRFNAFVVSIVQDQQGKIILIKQFRPPLMRETWELPMGAINKGEKPLTAAQREFGEETGFRAENWQRIGEFYVGPGHTDQKGLVYVAENPQKAQAQLKPDEGEIISQIKKLSLQQLDNQIKNGKINDGPTISALYLAKSYLKERS